MGETASYSVRSHERSRKRFVIFFDANMPLPMREYLKPRMPYAEFVFLNGDIHRNGKAGLHRVSDSEVLAVTLERAKSYPALRPYLVTQDQSFEASAGYDPELHPIGIFIIPGLTSAIFQRAIEDRIINYFENELKNANPS